MSAEIQNELNDAMGKIAILEDKITELETRLAETESDRLERIEECEKFRIAISSARKELESVTI